MATKKFTTLLALSEPPRFEAMTCSFDRRTFP